MAMSGVISTENRSRVTILEQVCYAISELAYCNDFSIADILTAEDGKIALHNQFWLPLRF